MTSAASPLQARHYGMGLIAPCRAIDIDLSNPVQDIVVGAEYRGVLALVTDGDDPLGSLILPVRDGTLTAYDVVRGIRSQLGEDWLQVLVRRRLEAPLPALGVDTVDELVEAPPPPRPMPPAATVVVCTRGRPALLERCLQALARQDHPAFDVLVVDNAPADDAVRQLVAQHFPGFRYVVEPRPGLSVARNRGVAEALHGIVAFTDDDAVPRPSWLRFLVAPFGDDPQVGMVTGLTAPLALDSEPQVMAETHRTLDRGYRRRRIRVDVTRRPRDTLHYTPDRFGAGVNMAMRKACLDELGWFDEDLGAGSHNRAGEDMDVSFRLLEAGYTQVYEPAAIVRHYHRDTWQGLRTQWSGWTRGYLAFLIRTVRRDPANRLPLAAFAAAQVGRLLRAGIRAATWPSPVPAGLARVEALAAIVALGEWRRRPAPLATPGGRAAGAPHAERSQPPATAVRRIDLGRPLGDLDDVGEFDTTVVHVCLSGRMLGSVRLDNRRAAISRQWLLDAIAARLADRVFTDAELNDADSIRTGFVDRLLPPRPSQETVRPMELIHGSLSVVIATRDRPALLRACLESLAAQDTSKDFEVVVVDNNPASGLTRPVAASFANVVLVEQPSGGTSAARNRGVESSTGELIAFIDDDVTVPRQWVNMLMRVFARADACAVTGNVLPASLSTPAQALFEAGYGFGRGFDVLEYGPSFFDGDPYGAPPVSNLGAGAMVCVRRAVLEESGLFCEALGPGTPARAGEDLYFIYRLLKTSWTVLYSPHVCGFHYHRDTLPALYRQIFNYGIGVYAYLAATIVRDRELRSLMTMAIHYPVAHLRRLVIDRDKPPSLVLVEMAGNLVGPFAYLVSSLRTRMRRAVPAHRDASSTMAPATVGEQAPANAQGRRKSV